MSLPKLRHLLVTVAAIVAATVPALLADPAVRSMVANHPWVAAYLPVVSGVIVAVYHALTAPSKSSGAGP